MCHVSQNKPDLSHALRPYYCFDHRILSSQLYVAKSNFHVRRTCAYDVNRGGSRGKVEGVIPSAPSSFDNLKNKVVKIPVVYKPLF